MGRNIPSLTTKTNPTISTVAYVVDSSADFKIDRDGLANWLSLGTVPKVSINDLTSAGSGSLAGSALNIEQYWSTSGSPTAIKLSVTEGEPVSSSDSSQLLDLQINSTSLFKISKYGFVQVGDGNLLGGLSVLGLGYFGRNTAISEFSIALKNSSIFGWTNSTLSPDASSTLDVKLSRDTSNALALKNSTNSQDFRIYKTWTATNSYERLSIKSDATNFYILPEKGSTAGTKRPLFIDGVQIGLGGADISSNIAIGADSLKNNYLGVYNIAIGLNALTSQKSGAKTIGSIVGGSLYTTGTYTVQSTWVSGPTATVYPTLIITVSGGSVQTVSIPHNGAGYGFTTIGTVLTAVLPDGLGSGFSCQVTELKNTSNNVAIGYKSLETNKSGDYNTSIGSFSLNLNTYGSYNSACGYQCLYFNTTGSYNTSFGPQSLQYNTIGSDNCAFGFASLVLNTTGIDNCAFGSNSLRNNGAGNNNSAFGKSALYLNTGNNNSAFGNVALLANTTGSGNLACGQQSLLNNSTGSNNTALGYNSLASLTASSENTAVGNNSLLNLSSGASNVAIGSGAGRLIEAGTGLTASTNSIFLGYNSRANAISQTNQIVIGYGTIGLGSNTTVIGNGSTLTTKVYGVKATGQVAPTIASSSTIAPTCDITFISGTAAIATITPPTGISSTGGQITLIPTEIFTTTTAGNIALATTAVVKRALIMTYDFGTLKWYPSY